MRKLLGPMFTCALAIFGSSAALACDPYVDWCEYEYYPPADAVVVSTDAPASDPATEAAALGLHLVTDVYAGETVTTQGLVTTYATTTIEMNAGTAATRVASLGTGEASDYDALVFNARTALSDGRAVAGDVYANYVYTSAGWTFDRYVFFQDDEETRRLASAPPLVSRPAPVPTAVVPTSGETPVAQTAFVPAYIAPITGDGQLTSGTTTITSPATGGPSDATPRSVRAGLAVSPQADPLARIEVLRGRRVALWVRATVDGTPTRVIAWRLTSGELTALGPVSGTGDEPLAAMWPSLAPRGSAFTVWVRASVDVPGEGTRDVAAQIAVVVLSPALVE